MSTLMNRRCLQRCGLLAVLALVALGCGPEFDPPSKLQSLRVLAVKKDDPYLRPTAPGSVIAGESDGAYQPDNVAHLTLAMQDSRLEEDRQGPLQKIWFAGCNNPPRDNYFSCLLNVWLTFKAFVELGPGPGGLADGQTWSIGENYGDIGQVRLSKFVEETFPEQSEQARQAAENPDAQQTAAPGLSQDDLINQALALRVGAGDRFDYTVPPWVIEQHPPSQDRDIPRYGLSQVFLAVCDGEIGFSPGWERDVDPLETLADATRGFPLTCYERGTTRERGPDHFMVSYSNLYVYDELSNKNPVIDGFRFDGKKVDESSVCIGEDCLAKAAPSCDADSSTPRVKLCDPRSSSGCKEYEITPVLDESKNSEMDDIASRVGGGDAQLREQMWIRYYADQGEIVRETKRLQDANDGWFLEHTSKWKVPSEGEGIVNIWSVVYDNRGGVDWARVSVCLEK